jgi:hypothetical protein
MLVAHRMFGNRPGCNYSPIGSLRTQSVSVPANRNEPLKVGFGLTLTCSSGLNADPGCVRSPNLRYIVDYRVLLACSDS